MEDKKLRDNRTCLNCGHQVEERFCPHCGQENIENRQSFHFLFTHFIEDFTHYDGQFWKTIQYLFTRPGILTKEYLEGKRQLYVAPVKLYIFISFITFFLPNILPHAKEEAKKSSPHLQIKVEQRELSIGISQEVQKEEAQTRKDTTITQKALDTLKIKDIEEKKDFFDGTSDTKEASVMDAYSIEQYDSILAKDKTGIYTVMRPVSKKIFELMGEGFTKHQIWKKYKENLIHTVPKALFVYLPIFTFFLWLFHNKKKWWYFDHGIFTLHYFSFLLLDVLILIIGEKITSFLPGNNLFTLLYSLVCLALAIYMTVYLFLSHYRVYETKKRTSILKGSLLFIINSIGLMLMFMILIYLSFLTLH
ncbi:MULTISPECIES: DUF3667 domain-containing protein [unclassified Chryseobacterium]|uniref:DUF3667 domain-containing protein n=1 Tax=unclassified Chryseobacterium TaxID=2593645 RepID=UPI001AE8C309|nr:MULTISPECIES: DUF3667 domain-containing protein [unclassified Chryseobacterium]MBP1164604.1 hypothetical protein [Chryseobacterium sp. PvR013]